MTGTHTAKKCVEMFNSRAITLDSQLPFPVHGDGELFGTDVLRIEVSILPSHLNIVVGQRSNN
jgi:diacylglycerol kinase family enzyme